MSRTAQLPPGTYSEPAAERAFLGYYLETTGDRADLRAEVLALDLDLFTVPKHRTVATAMQQIAATGDPVNVTTVEHRLHTASANVTQADLHALVSQAAVTPGSYRRVLVDYQGRRRVDSILRVSLNSLTHGEPPADVARATAAACTATRPTTSEVVSTFRPLRAFLDEPEDAVDWIVEGLLPAGGLSLFAAKPKVGKSTLLRYLAHCVGSGRPFLGRTVTQGTVLYVSLEERRKDVRAHFRRLAAHDANDPPVHVHVGPVPGTPTGTSREAIRRHRLAWLRDEIDRFRPTLVEIDTWGRFLNVKDGNDYAETTDATEPLITLARTTGAHFAFSHHAKKGVAPEDMIDALLGSTAIAGSVDTVLVESRQRDNLRSITTNQRVGDEIDPPGLVLLLDKDAGTLSLGASLADTRMDTLIARIITCLVTHPWQSERTLRDEVPGCDSNLSKALREAMRRGQVCQDGGGKKGDPHVYAAASETRAYKAKEQQREEKAERAKEAKEANQPDVQFSDSRLSGSLASNLWEPTE